MIYKGSYNGMSQNGSGEEAANFAANPGINKPIDVERYYNINGNRQNQVAQPYAIPMIESISENEMFSPAPVISQSGQISSADDESGAEYLSYNRPNQQSNNSYAPIQPSAGYGAPVAFSGQNQKDLSDFAQTQTGRKVTADFLIGDQLVSKTGYILKANQNYILLSEENSDDVIGCDFDNIKFIRFYSE